MTQSVTLEDCAQVVMLTQWRADPAGEYVHNGTRYRLEQAAWPEGAALIRAAQAEIDRLTAENERLRGALRAAPHVEVYDQTIRYDFEWPQYAKWYTETRRAALKEKP